MMQATSQSITKGKAKKGVEGSTKLSKEGGEGVDELLETYNGVYCYLFYNCDVSYSI